jgi:hypothetical protein
MALKMLLRAGARGDLRSFARFREFRMNTGMFSDRRQHGGRMHTAQSGEFRSLRQS